MLQSTQPSFEDLVGIDPMAFFAHWYQEAQSVGIVEPSAMALATATADGKPSVRMVLLRGLDARGIVFYTNHRSRKGVQIQPA